MPVKRKVSAPRETGHRAARITGRAGGAGGRGGGQGVSGIAGALVPAEIAHSPHGHARLHVHRIVSLAG